MPPAFAYFKYDHSALFICFFHLSCISRLYSNSNISRALPLILPNEDAELAPLVGPFYAGSAGSSGSAVKGVYVHPQCAWWSNHFPWHELATAPSCLVCYPPQSSYIFCKSCIAR